MLGRLTKKRISEDKIAAAFANTIVDIVDKSFEDVAALVNEDPNFLVSPNINKENADQFLMIVITGNLKLLSDSFNTEQENRMKLKIIENFARVFGMSDDEFYSKVKEYSSYMSRINHPSKNTLYSMSKALFFKYDLNKYQDEYFKGLNSPNPVFLKRIDEIMEHFIWKWDVYLSKYKLNA